MRCLRQLCFTDMQLSTLGLVWPALMLTYLGQASYLTKHPDMVPTAYYASVPRPVFWPMFVLAVLSAIIASQVICLFLSCLCLCASAVQHSSCPVRCCACILPSL